MATSRLSPCRFFPLLHHLNAPPRAFGTSFSHRIVFPLFPAFDTTQQIFALRPGTSTLIVVAHWLSDDRGDAYRVNEVGE